jgi:hypothetical protein
MKFIASIILTILLAYAFGLYLPWWSITLAAFIVAVFIHQKALWAFLSGALALLLLWGIMAWVISGNNDHILAHRISSLMIKKDSPMTLIALTALLGAIPAGFAALSGSLLRKLIASSY